ncbi:beta-ketoacyl-[acyl-carrier-protein] synthase family protein [Streptomyces tanashiensis]|uniref:beta-ketoacyl-[acyl-carrier-protein] synthase family protein n=1 Tax=Streptomyces tanashiensis TaxID=67367 RepID=UPI0033FDF926
MTSVEVVVTGFGVLSPSGIGAAPILDSVFAGHSAVSAVTRFDTDAFLCHHAATYEREGPTQRFPQQAAITACAEAAIAMSGIDALKELPVIVGAKGDLAPRDGVAVRRPAFTIAEAVAEGLGLGGLRRTFFNACVASSNAIIHACQLVAAGAERAVLCGGGYLVDEHVFAHFDSVRALSRIGAMAPFSRNWPGVLLGDGAAMFVVESAAGARQRGATPLAKVAGWGMTSDGFHIVHPDPSGRSMARAISLALQRAGIGAEELGYINAHGTGTEASDRAEAAAYHLAFGNHADGIPISSTKASTGHSLEGCGALETVITLLALTSGQLPPTVGLTDPAPDCKLRHIADPGCSLEAGFALSVNASVGGVNSALLLERPS